MSETAPPPTATARIFKMPSLGADMESAAVLEWLVQPGDLVQRGDVIARVETEKSDIDVEIWEKGRVIAHLVEIGEDVPVGTPILQLGTSVESTDPISATPAVVAPSSSSTGTGPAPAQVRERVFIPEPVAEHDLPPTSEPARDLRASPLARSMASALDIDLATIAGSGPEGAIIARDLPFNSMEGTVEAPAKSQPVAIDRMREAIATRMARANHEIPHYHLERDVDLGTAMDWLERSNECVPPGERVLPAALFVKAVARSMAEHPNLNGFWVDDRFQAGDGVHVGMAISLRTGGLVIPTIVNADRRTISEVMSSLREMVAGSRSGSMRSSWMHEATVTVTNLGTNGADRVHGVIFPPQVALIGFGRIAARPWVAEEQVRPRPVVTISLAADHRATDGATGSRLLSTLAHSLEHPEEL
ncbi:MAG: 2-oxo acid dehydrogenase subunit E2 [Acidimicrobiales bacterium]|nr:2-oxo acid dehydrogenase subunit E2 [Acidimicrobiales bacterium]